MSRQYYHYLQIVALMLLLQVFAGATTGRRFTVDCVQLTWQANRVLKTMDGLDCEGPAAAPLVTVMLLPCVQQDLYCTAISN